MWETLGEWVVERHETQELQLCLGWMHRMALEQVYLHQPYLLLHSFESPWSVFKPEHAVSVYQRHYSVHQMSALLLPP